MCVFEIRNVSFHYDQKLILKDINTKFETGKIYAIVGPSGSGKTTLLSLMSGLTKLQDGDILFKNKSIKTMDLYHFRSHDIGMIFQSYYLLNQLSALENVLLSMDIAGISNKEPVALSLLEKVGLESDQIHRSVLKLSGGQQQRVGIARALSYNPEILLADEPTGNLDSKTANDIMDLFQSLKKQDKCIILVTHSKEIASRADQIIPLEKQE